MGAPLKKNILIVSSENWQIMKLIEKFKKIGSSVFGFIFRIILIVSSENWQKNQKKNGSSVFLIFLIISIVAY